MEETPRPLSHFSPPGGWMNDPNGLIHHAGEWHLFYQAVPPGASGKHWGHAVSTDLVRWEHLPVALAPDALGEIWSGSIVADGRDTSGFFFDGDGGLVAIYTNACVVPQCQSLAYSRDRGRIWTKYDGNPVLTSDRADFRDPKVFWHAKTLTWVMIVAAGREIEIHTAPDLKTWTHASTFGGAWLPTGAVFECPDLFPLSSADGGERWILSVSLIGPGNSPAGLCETFYWVGSFDRHRFQADQGQPSVGNRTDFGPDNYAAVTWEDAPESGRFCIGWMARWAYAEKLPTAGWSGQMTLPRCLSLDAAGRLRQTPADALRGLRVGTRRWEEIRVDGGSGTKICADTGEAFEIVADIRPGRAGECGLRLRVGRDGGEMTTVGVDTAKGTVFVDRTRSGQVNLHPGFAGRYDAPLRLPEGEETVRLHIFVDRYSVEIFAGEGETLLTALIFAAPASQGLEFYADDDAAAVARLELYGVDLA